MLRDTSNITSSFSSKYGIYLSYYYMKTIASRKPSTGSILKDYLPKTNTKNQLFCKKTPFSGLSNGSNPIYKIYEE